MKNIILISTFLLFSAITANAQCDTVEDCRQKLSTATQIINKEMAKSDALESVVEAQDRVIKLQAETIALDNEIIKKKEIIISEQDKAIKILEKKSRPTFSVLWGLIKVRL